MRSLLLISIMMLSGCVGSVIPDDNSHPVITHKLSTSYPSTQMEFDLTYIDESKMMQYVRDEIVREINAKYNDLPPPRAEKPQAARDVVERKSSVQVDVSDRDINVSFLSGEYYGQRKGESYQRASYPYRAHKDGKRLVMNIDYPGFYLARNGNMGLRGTIYPLFQVDDAESVFKSTFDEISSVTVSHETPKTYQGTLTSKYSADAIYSNFASHAKSVRTGRDGTVRTVTVSPVIDGVPMRIYVDVMPYRTGSKVMYRSQLAQRMVFSGDGAVRLSNIPTDQRIKSFIKSIVDS